MEFLRARKWKHGFCEYKSKEIDNCNYRRKENEDRISYGSGKEYSIKR